MSVFDALYFSVFNHAKKRFKKRVNTISLLYVTILQCALILLLGVFFSEFLNQMKVNTMSATKAWTLFIIVCTVIYFKNWMQYSGKKRNILRAQKNSIKSKDFSVFTLLLLPIGIIVLSILLLKVL